VIGCILACLLPNIIFYNWDKYDLYQVLDAQTDLGHSQLSRQLHLSLALKDKLEHEMWQFVQNFCLTSCKFCARTGRFMRVEAERIWLARRARAFTEAGSLLDGPIVDFRSQKERL
jgi:hypothetical protein